MKAGRHDRGPEGARLDLPPLNDSKSEALITLAQDRANRRRHLDWATPATWTNKISIAQTGTENGRYHSCGSGDRSD
jgi:hypothetical protein